MRTTPDNITKLKPGEIFVFGSNMAGHHGAGAAALAYLKFGAKWKEGKGLWGQSYAIPTKDWQIQTLSLASIQRNINEFLDFAEEHPDLKFLVTKIGCGLAGCKEEEIAPMFKKVPSNVILPKGWRKRK